MIDIKFEVTIRVESIGIGSEARWEKTIQFLLNEAFVYSHCDEVKFISSKEITE